MTNQLGFKFKSKRLFFFNISGLIPNVCSFESNLSDLYSNLSIDWSLITILEDLFLKLCNLECKHACQIAKHSMFNC